MDDRLAGTRSVGGLAPRSESRNRLGRNASPIVSNTAQQDPRVRSKTRSFCPDLRSQAPIVVRPRPANEDDGVLTAEEVASLDLSGVEWAVLSACDTGLGEIKAGEGVFGPRRAFQIAGARTVIMSLWSVEDRAAMTWMRAL